MQSPYGRLSTHISQVRIQYQMASTLKFIREDLIGGSFSKVNSILPDISSLELKDNTFTKLAILVGLVAAVKGTFTLLSWIRLPKTKLSSNLTEYSKRYGDKSWAIIGDISHNQSYALFLAARGVNLILLGTQQDIDMGKDIVHSQSPLIDIESVEVDWEKEQLNESFYKTLVSQFEYYDISIIVTPKIKSEPLQNFSAESHIPVVAPVFLIVSAFLKKLKARAYRSAIIINCDFRSGRIEVGKSLENAAVSAVETFGRTLEYEIRDFCDVVIAKADEVSAFDSLGVNKISEAK